MTETSKQATRRIVERIARLPLLHQLGLCVRLVRDRRVPWAARLPLVFVLAYLAMPLDLIPDFIPVIGQLDDLLIVGVATWWFLRACPPELLLVGLEELEATPLTRLQRMAPWLVAALLALGTAVALWVVFFR